MVVIVVAVVHGYNLGAIRYDYKILYNVSKVLYMEVINVVSDAVVRGLFFLGLKCFTVIFKVFNSRLIFVPIFFSIISTFLTFFQFDMIMIEFLSRTLSLLPL